MTTQARWFDEGPVAVLDAGQPASCPPGCEDQTTCDFCDETTCPTHGGDQGLDAEDSHLSNTCRGAAHRRCHDSACREASCWD